MDSLRLDKFLWFTRFAKTRGLAQQQVEQGRFRIDGRPVDRAAASVRIGNILTFVGRHGEVRTIRVEILPIRRGPPGEARACYQELIPGGEPEGQA